ncbi:MAG: methylated-DNA--[protein]-cysteine S-methyltransferase [Actinomycetota bacterium]
MKELKRLANGAPERAASAASVFVARAGQDGSVDVALGDLDSPIGRLTVAVTPRGLARVIFESEDRDGALQDLAERLSPRVLEAPEVTDAARRQLEAYFVGTLRRFDLALDRRLMSRFVGEVMRRTERVGFGEMSTYGQIARDLGRPTASRAVGAALGANPIPIVLPCHRIVGANGRLTGYAGGLDRKEFLLRLEGSLAV